jgi:hypothetical protein
VQQGIERLIRRISRISKIMGKYAHIGTSEDCNFWSFRGGELREFANGEAEDWRGSEKFC